ncbi:hypothetical protein [Pontibacter populi]|uniref:HNH endonuclease n=1 Tax=Pontibacter populi TaxID=890055 RepID=A0ABV1RXI0_9BACT
MFVIFAPQNVQAMADLKLYDPFPKMQFTDEHCFLCGTTITTADRTPVFGEWMQDNYNLRDKELLLLDKSVTTFNRLTIPCCQHCHTNYILPLEKEIEAAAEAGYEGINSLDPKRLFQWIGKMYYGTLVTELIKEKDPLILPENPVSENPQMLGKFKTFYQVLQSLRVPMEFSDFLPCSLFILQVDPTEDELPFEYQDEITTMAFSIKLGPVVIVCKLLDNGIIRNVLNRLYNLTEGQKLHPIQVAEFKARVFYAAYIFNVVPDYFIRPGKADDELLTIDTLIDDITNDVFNPFEPLAYAHMLEEMLKPWSIREPEILKDPAKPLTFLTNEDGTLREITSFEK